MNKIRGIIVPMVTPFNEKGDIDYSSTKNLINYLISGGVHGIFVLGTTGEAQSVALSDRKKFVEFVGKEIDGRVPYLVCVTDTSMKDSCELAEIAKKSGAVAVVAAPPYYYSPSQLDMINLYTTLADKSPLPVFLYNMPGHVKVSIAPDTVKTLASHPNIWGLKDSSANMTYFQTLKYLTSNEENFSLYVGPEELTAECVLMGAEGAVNGGANMFPELYVKMYNAAVQQNMDLVARLQKCIMQISVSIYSVGEGPSSYLQGLKSALEQLGICKGYLALPYSEMKAEGKEKIAKALKDIDTSIWK
jgi:Dihydrodipicolinate synthase/N-acetylneuraminate lyase